MAQPPAPKGPSRGRRPINADSLRKAASKGRVPRYRAVPFDEVRTDAEVLALIQGADAVLESIGFTDHGIRHISRVANRAMQICKDLGLSPRDRELAGIAAYLHDIGNAVHRQRHAQSSAVMAYPLLTRMGMDPLEIAVVMGAIGNHDEHEGEPVNNASAALILADKSDVLRSRVRSSTPMLTRDIHDRVNFASTASILDVDRTNRMITLKLSIDTNVAPVMEYFELFLGRMAMCRRAANFLNCDFLLVINGHRLL